MRLTETSKSKIVNNTVKAVFAERVADLKEQGNVLAETFYAQLYPQSVQDKMNKLPDEFFSQKSQVFVECDGRGIDFILKSSRKISAYDNNYRRPSLLLENEADKTTVKQYVKDKEKLDNDKKLFETELQGFLAGISTDKKLKEVWPEGELYYNFLIAPVIVNLPAIQSDKINSLIANMKKL